MSFLLRPHQFSVASTTFRGLCLREFLGFGGVFPDRPGMPRDRPLEPSTPSAGMVSVLAAPCAICLGSRHR